MRAVTRTTLALGDLLEIPIGIVAATGKQEVKFDTAAPDGAPRAQQYVHPTRTRTLYETLGGEEANVPVEVPEVLTESIKGVRVGDTFHAVPPSEIEYATAASRLDTVELLEFIDFRNVPTDRLSGSFWIQPDPGFDRPLATLIRAMRLDGKAMLVKYAVKSRQRLGVIRVRKTDEGDALLLNDVVFAANWRDADERVLAAGQVKEIDERAVNAALQIIEAHHGTGQALKDAEDDLIDLQVQVVERAHDGLYDDPARVLDLAAVYATEGLQERSTRLLAWAEERWPTLEGKREEVERVIADGGDDVGGKLAALVG